MNNDILKLFDASDGQLVTETVTEVSKTDFDSLCGYANHFRNHRDWPRLIQVQHRMLEAMSVTIAHLKKQNALMDADYKRGKQ